MMYTFSVTYKTAAGLFVKEFELDSPKKTEPIQAAATMEMGKFRELLPLYNDVYAEIRYKDTGAIWCYLTVVCSEEFEHEHHGRKGYSGHFLWHNVNV